MKKCTNILKDRLQKALKKSGRRKIAIFGYQTPALITSAALIDLHANLDCYLHLNHYMEGTEFFSRPVRSLEEVLQQNRDHYFIIDVSHLKHQFNQVIKQYDLSEKEYSRLGGLFKYEACDLIDPLLAYNRMGDLAGFHIFGDQQDKRAIRIATLGGSTTDWTYSHMKGWPEYLHENLEEADVPNVIFNGGIVGYTSVQERDKFLRDVLQLSPDLVLVLSGDNDIGWNHGYRDRNFYSGYLIDQIVDPVYRKSKEPFEEVGYGLNEDIEDYENWFKNQKLCRTISEEMGIKFYCFLQPSIFTAGYQADPFEKGWLDIMLGTGRNSFRTVSNITENWKSFYDGARKLISSENGFADLTDAFDEISGVYIDGIHCCEVGNEILAEKIRDVILADQLKKGSKFSIETEADV